MDHQVIDILMAEIDIYELFAFKHIAKGEGQSLYCMKHFYLMEVPKHIPSNDNKQDVGVMDFFSRVDAQVLINDIQVSFRVEYPKDYDDQSEEDHKGFKHIRHDTSNQEENPLI